MNSKHLTLLRHPLGFLVIGIVPLIIGVAGCSNSTRAEGESKAVRTGGGPCEYNRYQGACRITSVRQMGSDVMVHGTCTPIHFDFPAINLSDYFEIQER
jgi:hypothetical protein